MGLRFERASGCTRVYDADTNECLAELRRMWEVLDMRPGHAGTIITAEYTKRAADAEMHAWWRRQQSRR